MAHTLLEYIWIGGNNELRSKTRVRQFLGDGPVHTLTDVPNWNYDGSSTNQAPSDNSEVLLTPVAMFNDPFRGGPHRLILCETYNVVNNMPLITNSRHGANAIFNKKLNEEPWFGLEQEYFLMNPKTKLPLGFPTDENATQGQYYCSAGAENAFGREIVEEHLKKCLYAGIKISGVNAEVAPGQWEFQVGPCIGIDEGDHMWVARYILQRVAETRGIIVNFDPKPISGDWNGSGCHINFSTKNMREGTYGNTGLYYINEAIHKLSLKHDEHMAVYGVNNDKRMTGQHETASYGVFSDGIANRGASVRRGHETIKNQKGYFEDRRPASNCDPYLATAKIFETCV
jgi:glutamine synthetase